MKSSLGHKGALEGQLHQRLEAGRVVVLPLCQSVIGCGLPEGGTITRPTPRHLTSAEGNSEPGIAVSHSSQG